MKRLQKSYLSMVFIPWAIIAVFVLSSPLVSYLDKSKPSHFDPPADFHIVLSRNVGPALQIFYQGDSRLIRMTTARSPKAVVMLLQKKLDHPNTVAGMTKSHYEYIKRNKAVESLKWPSIPHGPTGDCYFIRHGGMTYSKFFIWPDGKGGTVIEVLEGFED